VKSRSYSHVSLQQRPTLPDPFYQMCAAPPSHAALCRELPAVTAAHLCSNHGCIHLMSGSGEVDATSLDNRETTSCKDFSLHAMRPQKSFHSQS
jgi:hypothetical protein